MIPPILAQLTGNPPPPEGFSDWLHSATYLIWLAAGAVILWKRIKKPAALPVDVENSPLTVAPAVNYVTAPDYKKDMDKVDERLNSATKSRKDLHERVDAHGQRISALEKSERHTDAALANIDQKLTTILQRLPR
jgi:septal ring factor EnvC (AmiA/AmiB activator)